MAWGQVATPGVGRRVFRLASGVGHSGTCVALPGATARRPTPDAEQTPDARRPTPSTLSMARIYDVSIPVRDGGVCYPGNPEIRITPQQAISKGAGANVSASRSARTPGRTSTPSSISLMTAKRSTRSRSKSSSAPAVLIDFPDDVMAVTAAMLREHDLHGQRRVLIKTRNSALRSAAGFRPRLHVPRARGAEYLVELGVQLVGVDYLSVEQFHSGHHKTHNAARRRAS